MPHRAVDVQSSAFTRQISRKCGTVLAIEAVLEYYVYIHNNSRANGWGVGVVAMPNAKAENID
jgi:hypothetical protein